MQVSTYVRRLEMLSVILSLNVYINRGFLVTTKLSNNMYKYDYIGSVGYVSTNIDTTENSQINQYSIKATTTSATLMYIAYTRLIKWPH